MKTRSSLYIASIALVLSFSMKTNAREALRHSMDIRPSLTEVNWLGTLVCDGEQDQLKRLSDSACEPKFVRDVTQEVWEVKNRKDVSAMLEQSRDLSLRVHLNAKRSPRFLLGGNYVEVQKIEPIPSKGSEQESLHVCKLSNAIQR